MAVTPGQGFSNIRRNKRWENYPSLKQSVKHRTTEEIHIRGNCTTDGGATEISFCDNILNYIAAEGQVYIRCEADDANQHSKYVYIEYQDDTGAVMPVLTADLNGADSTTEVIVTGASDFYRLRRMYSEVESDTGGGKSITLCDADANYVADMYGEIKDANTNFALERFFTQPSATCDSYLALVSVRCASTGGAATDDTFFIEATLTPRASNWGAEAATAADITMHHEFQDAHDGHPCILLEGGTEVSFKIGDNASPGNLFIHAVMLEVYPVNSTPSS